MGSLLLLPSLQKLDLTMFHVLRLGKIFTSTISENENFVFSNVKLRL